MKAASSGIIQGFLASLIVIIMITTTLVPSGGGDAAEEAPDPDTAHSWTLIEVQPADGSSDSSPDMSAGIGGSGLNGAGATGKRLELDYLNGPYDPLHDDVPLPLRWQSAGAQHYGVLQFTGPVYSKWLAELEGLGFRFYDYVPFYAFFVGTDDPGAFSAAALLPYVRYAGPFHDGFKISPSIGGPDRDFTGDDEWMTVYVAVLDDLESLLAHLALREHDVLALGGSRVTISIRASEIPGIAALESVKFIESVPELEWLNDEAAYILRVRPVWNQMGLDGTGQIVGIGDTGLDTGNVHTMTTDLRGRVVAIYDWTGGSATPTDTHGHGTHTTGSILGSGNHSEDEGAGPYQYRGMAYNASIVFQALQGGFTALGDLNNLYQEAYDDGARIHSNSWGLSTNNQYTTDAENTDEFLWDHKDMCILFSAGNDGPGAGTVRAPSLAKNTVSVGASQNYRPSYGSTALDPEALAPFSSWGPTADGRRKPDVTAPGTGVRSIRSSASSGSGYYVDNSGTSMSCPLTAGTTALVRQWYEDYEGITPSGALLKATLINGAHDLYNVTSPVPNMVEGWGRVNLTQSIMPKAPTVLDYYDNKTGLTTGNNHTYEFLLGNNSVPLRVALVWTDYDGNPAVTIQAVNNLNLNVTGPDGTLYKGNVFTKGKSVSGGFNDNVNNVECVRFHKPVVGKYTIEVRAVNVPQGPQPYALMVSYGENDGTGVVDFDLDSYKLPLKPRVCLIDSDLAGSGTATVTVTSPTDQQGEELTLTENPSGSGLFKGKVTLTESSPGTGQVQVINEDIIRAAYNDSSLGGWVYDRAVVDTGAPTNLTVEPAPWGNTLNLSWKARTIEPDIVGYTIYRSTQAISGYQKIKQVPYITKTMDINLTDYVKYYYKMKSLNASGFESGFSLSASGTPRDIFAPKMAFTTPSSQSPISAQTFLNWSADNDTQEVELEYYLDTDMNGVDDDGGAWTPIEVDDTPGDGYVWDTTALPNGSRVMVTARATDEVPLTGPNATLINLTLDNIAPPAPVLDELPGYYTRAAQNLTGTAEVGSTVWLYRGGTLNATDGTDALGDFRVPVEMAEGLNSYTARAVDYIGNGPGDPSNTITTTLDTIPPVAGAGGDREAQQGIPLVMNGSASHDRNGIVEYEWSFYDNAPYIYKGAEAEHGFDSLGEHVVTLEVWDPAGHSGKVDINVTVVDSTPPVVDAGEDQTVNEDTVVQLDGSGSHDNNPSFSLLGTFDWSFTEADGSERHLRRQNPSYTFETPGLYQLTLTVTDPAGLTGTDVVNITAQDITPPVAYAGEDVEVEEGGTVEFYGGYSTDNDPAFPVGAGFAWTFVEDRRTVSLEWSEAEHTFDIPDVYTVTLTVTDAAGNKNKDRVQVNVTEVDAPDDGGDGDDEPLPTFTIESITPAHDTRNVDIMVRVVVVFAADVLITSISQSTMELLEGGPQGTPVAGSVNPDGTINGARFVPAAPLKYSTTYTAVISPRDLLSTSGAVLDQKHTATFVTEAEPTDTGGGGDGKDSLAEGDQTLLLFILVIIIAVVVIIGGLTASARKKRTVMGQMPAIPADPAASLAISPYSAGDPMAAGYEGIGEPLGPGGVVPGPIPLGGATISLLPPPSEAAATEGPVGMSIDELEGFQKEAHDEEEREVVLEEGDPLLDEVEPGPGEMEAIAEDDPLMEAATAVVDGPSDRAVFFGMESGEELTVAGAAEAAEIGEEKEFSYESAKTEAAPERGDPDLECPECGAGVWTGDLACPGCGVEFDLSDDGGDEAGETLGDMELDLDDDDLLDD